MKKSLILLLAFVMGVQAMLANEITENPTANAHVKEGHMISGHVIEKDTEEDIPYASILIVGTDKGTVSNESGQFQFKNLTEGSYVLRVSAVGYRTLEKTITVVDNPTKLYEIDGKIYLISQGNYADVAGALQSIDPKTGTSKVILNDVTKITEGNNDLIYCISATYDANWQLSNSFFTYNPSTGAISETSFLQDAPSSFSTAAIYLLEVDEETGFIYVGTSDYTTNGTIYQFDKSGKLVQSFDSGGINPSAMVFIND